MMAKDIMNTSRQHGAARIEITAIVMLLTAMAIVLSVSMPSVRHSGVAQAGEPVHMAPAPAVGTGIPVAPGMQLQPAPATTP